MTTPRTTSQLLCRAGTTGVAALLAAILLTACGSGEDADPVVPQQPGTSQGDDQSDDQSDDQDDDQSEDQDDEG